MFIRTSVWMGMLFIGWLPTVAGADAPAVCDPWDAKVVSIQGKVEAKRSTTTDWQPVILNSIYCSGDSLRVGENSRAAVVLSNETLLRLDQNSAITLTAIHKESPSLLELITGFVHFISRVPHSLKVNTPYVNAAIEGTEFVVAVSKDKTSVTVFEGTVLAQNAAGEVRITHNETAQAMAGGAPQKILLAKPRDAVQWALYYPPILAKDDPLYIVSSLLYAGRVDEARQQLKQLPGEQSASGKAKALEAIIAVVQNDKDTALQLANDAVKLSANVAATHIALSYAQQAQFDLDAATQSATHATMAEPNNALAFARLAELQLSRSFLNDALVSAQHAVQLDAQQARAQTILGFAQLTRIDIDEATRTFEQAIVLDQADPLPHLGLGLAKIRKNNLAEGRREIEIAAMLDPNNALIRSYLGKAYFEEKRPRLDADQFAMAKELDPNDPTPWFYDAIRKQTENRPVEALEDLQKSIELNDNRAVYRSRLQLDQDEAARSASLARIYSDIGFEQLAVVEGAKSVNTDPTNFSAHRFLADSYNNLPRHEVARASELLQSQLLQPLNALPIQPQLSQTNLSLLQGAGPLNQSLNEYNPLFTRNGLHLQLNAVGGSNGTLGDAAVLSGIHDRFSYNVGQFHYATDGFRANNDLKENISNVFLQGELTSSINLQAEYRKRKTSYGDLDMSFDPADFSVLNRTLTDKETSRLGGHFSLSTNSDMLVSYIHANLDVSKKLYNQTPAVDETLTTSGNQYELQYLYHTNPVNIIAGMGSYRVHEDNLDNLDWTAVFGVPCPVFPPVDCQQRDIFTRDHATAYVYSNFTQPDIVNWTVGVSYDSVQQRTQDIKQIKPKLGLRWHLAPQMQLRAAYFETVTRAFVVQQTLEPTNVVGFNQFFDTKNGSLATNTGLGLDSSLTPSLHWGVDATRRDIDVPQFSTILNYANRKEATYRAYIHWAASLQWAVNSDVSQERINNKALGPARVDTRTLPLTIKYFSPLGLTGTLDVIRVTQEVDLGSFSSFAQTQEKFTLVNLGLAYRLSGRNGTIGLEVKNLFDTHFLYQDLNFITTEPSTARYVPERSVIARLTLGF